MTKSRGINIAIAQRVAQFLTAVFVDPDLQQLIQAAGRDIADELARGLRILIEGYPAAIGKANEAVGRRDDNSDSVAHKLRSAVLGPRNGLRSRRHRFLQVDGVTVKLSVLELAGTRVVENCEITLID